MQRWHLAALVAPTAVLWGWGSDSQATEVFIEFETTASLPESTSSPSGSSITPEDHRLSFVPPQVTTDLPTSQAANRSPETSQPLARASQGDPLEVPDAYIPTRAEKPTKLPPPPLSAEISDLFEGGANSLVARAVGSAEGTRTPHGQKTLAYYGHVDPGNQAWNQGTFSYQHHAQSPDEADQKQLSRLKRQTKELHRLASNQGLTLTTEEVLNGIDLANQAPIAALDRGYIDWLAQAKAMGLEGDDAIVWARTRSFLDPDTGRWNAPGLGNSVQQITQDQARRQRAIAQALAVNTQSWEPVNVPSPQPTSPSPVKSPDTKHDKIDVILLMNLPEP